MFILKVTLKDKMCLNSFFCKYVGTTHVNS